MSEWTKERIEAEKTRVNAFGKVEPYYLEALSEIERLQSELDKQWIPISERLPDEYTWVIVFRKGWKTAHVAKRTGDSIFYSVLGVRFNNITHWQPLPLPPTRKE